LHRKGCRSHPSRLHRRRQCGCSRPGFSERAACYNLDWFVQEAAEGRAEDYVLFGHAGHGSNSWAIHFYTVLRPLALFVQIGYGGAYMDRDLSVARLETSFAQAGELIAAAQAGKIDPSPRLLVVASDLTGGRWAWQSPGDPGSAGLAWLPSADVLGEALRAIQLREQG